MTSHRVIRLDGGETQLRAVTRRDTYRLDKAERLPNGALRVDALVTTTGVFLYHDSNGRPVKEYRPADEVKDPASVKTLRDSTVTVLHPSSLVTPANWDSVAVGHVSGDPIPQGNGIKCSLVVQSQDAIDLIESKKVQEISCGYQVMLEDSPGTTAEGEAYDSIQRQIRYNHVAMGPPGWGRQGSAVSLRLDSAGNQIEEQERHSMKLTIVFDGQTYIVDAGSAEHNDLLRRIAAKDAEIKSKLDAATADKKTLDTVTAERDVLVKKLDEATKQLAAAPDLAIVAVRGRLQLEGKASGVLGADYKFDGKKDRDIQVDMIKKFDPDFKADGLSDDYVRAACDTHTKNGSADRQSQMVLDQADLTKQGEDKSKARVDAKDPCDPNDPDPELARDRARQDSRKRGMQPLAVSTEKPRAAQ